MNLKHIKWGAGFAFMAILVLQGFWLVNMYQSYLNEYKQTINHCLTEATDIELTMRQLDSEQSVKYCSDPMKEIDNQMITQQITTEDTTVLVTFNRFEPHAIVKVGQYMMRFFSPLNVFVLDSIFYELLQQTRFAVKDTYIEYIDIRNNQILASSPAKNKPSPYYATDTFPIDILGSIGVRAYVNTPFFLILQQMFFRLLLSFVIIIVAFFCLFYLLYTIFQRNRLEVSRRDFVNTMTHEFQRPINAAIFNIAMATDYLEKSNVEDVKRYLKDADSDLRKLHLYTNKIQELSQGEDGFELDKTGIDLIPFFEKLQQKYAQRAEKPVELILNISQPQMIHADILHFSNIMENLLDNAIKYSGDAVKIIISFIKIQKSVKITIRDNGLGISSKEMPFVFEKFYRGKSEVKRHESGFGLGLSYVRTMVEAHEGTVCVHSEEGKYTEFDILLPCE